MREGFGQFPSSYRIDETNAAIVKRMCTVRQTADAAIRAISGYAVGDARLNQITSGLASHAEARDARS
jgi:hypothetical protein